MSKHCFYLTSEEALPRCRVSGKKRQLEYRYNVEGKLYTLKEIAAELGLRKSRSAYRRLQKVQGEATWDKLRNV